MTTDDHRYPPEHLRLLTFDDPPTAQASLLSEWEASRAAAAAAGPTAAARQQLAQSERLLTLARALVSVVVPSDIQMNPFAKGEMQVLQRGKLEPSTAFHGLPWAFHGRP